jgi:phage minor structural protein
MSGTVAEILAYLLKDTRWTSEGSDISGTYELETYHKQVRQCLTELCELCGGELQTHVEGATNGIHYRGASIVAQRGSRTVSRQFTYAHNMAGVSREENDSETVYTAVYCYGAPLEGQEGDYPERVTFAEINGGKSYLANDDMLEWWGCMGAEGEMHHTCTTYTDDACTDAAFLLAQGRKVLDNVSTPAVSYTADLSRIDQEGIQKVLIGDTIHVVDEEMGISFQKRVSYIAKKLDGTTSGKVVIGKRPNLLVEKFKAAETVSQKSTGNTSRVSSSTPTVRTNGYYGGSSRGGGDSVTHTLDGSPITGTVAFTTVGG